MRRSRWGYFISAVAGVSILATACSSSSSSSNGSGASGPSGSTITLRSVTELTGPAASFGVGSWQGEQLAVKNINDQGFLGKNKLSITVQDTTETTTGGASAMQEAVSSDALAVIGSIDTTDAQAEAPISDRAAMPAVYLGSLSTGITTNNGAEYKTNYLQISPITSYDDWAGKYLQANHIETVASIYDSDNVAELQQATQALPELASKYGFKVLSLNATSSTASDTASVVTKALSAKPQCIAVNVTGAQNATVVSEIRNAGFTGLILGNRGMNIQVLSPVGAKANGIVWPTDFDAALGGTLTQQFVQQYEAAYKIAPNTDAAAGYDAVWFIARAIKNASSLTRAGLATAMAQVADAGFDGVVGNLRYVDRVVQAPGLLVEYNDGKITAVPGYGGA
jgi:branched-chain amino acid transport system substrate-binding protein